MAFPVDTVPRDDHAATAIARIAAERDAAMIFVGLPRHLSGEEGPSAADSRVFAQELVELVSVPVRLLDERLTTTSAARAMSSAGRSVKDQRASIDAAAATVLLESALDIDRLGNLGTVTFDVPRKENHD